ncbi:unnamed protein product [Protopolystoma xenopodis]|uniref:Uncharacterized protein n=1 Tax=Protopolystoma xenopodis TaxID=117903 RepID=A0A448WEY2_9PLAT|nr:unnamed protein product [Protopolystoma xenopodis]
MLPFPSRLNKGMQPLTHDLKRPNPMHLKDIYPEFKTRQTRCLSPCGNMALKRLEKTCHHCSANLAISQPFLPALRRPDQACISGPTKGPIQGGFSSTPQPARVVGMRQAQLNEWLPASSSGDDADRIRTSTVWRTTNCEGCLPINRLPCNSYLPSRRKPLASSEVCASKPGRLSWQGSKHGSLGHAISTKRPMKNEHAGHDDIVATTKPAIGSLMSAWPRRPSVRK